MRKALAISAVAITMGFAVPVQAQFSVEARVGAGIPMGDNFEEFASTGFGFEANGAYAITPIVDLYAAFDWMSFGVEGDEDVEEIDADITDSGFGVGARATLPMAGSLQPWVRGGLIYHKLEISFGGDEGSFSVESDSALGFEAGAGIALPVAPKLSITPGIRFRTYTPEMADEEDEEEMAIRTLLIEIGGQYRP